ncbi:CAAX farnesyltransferase (FTase) subunit beta [Lithohypha guttulata]|nr:CAAX farnesyltransferase (FTase) subunit beta [Lithohypha guttulata]
MISRKRKVRFVQVQATPEKITINTKEEHVREETMDSTDEFEPFMTIPPHLVRWPAIRDTLSSSTSQLQAQTIAECLPLLNAINNPSSNPFDFDEHGQHNLNRADHIKFIRDGLQALPAQFVAMDASRPWLMYWSLLSLYVLGEDVKPLQSSIIKTFEPLQNKSGGFGGGQGHLSHLAGTYAVILAVSMVGGQDVYNVIDRVALWHWLGRLKQSNGGFCVCEDGEEDVRGAYCALVAITLLDLPWHLPSDSAARASGMTDFRDGLGEYLSSCQTYEGGIAASPSNEAHGAYTFCALACLSILGPPHETIKRYLNVESLLQWLSARQYAPEGGFAGRTNKVVDGCYSHWIGGCWPLVEAVLTGPDHEGESVDPSTKARIFSGEGLVRYILGCCQGPSGGLRDKPSKRPDAYHTCYNLCGLSMTKHSHVYYLRQSPDSGLLEYAARRNDLLRPTSKDVSEADSTSQEVAAFHPVYVTPHTAVHDLEQWSRTHALDFEVAHISAESK